MRARIIPVLRADFRLAETYRPTNLGPLSFRVPAVVVGARGDNRTTDEGLAAWARHLAPSREDAGVCFFDVRWVKEGFRRSGNEAGRRTGGRRTGSCWIIRTRFSR